MSETAGEQPKIITDDDWKSRAQAEKEELERRQREKRKAQAEAADQQDVELPPASFAMLVTTLATQAMAALGRVPDPIEGKPVTRLQLAKHHIDTLGVLEEKTRGNLTPDEQKMLSSLLHQLRMDYVAGGYQPPAEQSNAGASRPTP